MKSVVIAAEDRFAQLPELRQEEGIEFGWEDRLFYAYRDGKIFDYSDWESRDLEQFLKHDYKGLQIEAVKTLPILACERTIGPSKGDTGESDSINAIFAADPLSGGCEQSLDFVVAQMTSAAMYKKSFHEIVWDWGIGDFAGMIIPSRIAWRPQTTCRLARAEDTGKIVGFEQENWLFGAMLNHSSINNLVPRFIKRKNALIHIHGARRDPINGISDLEIPYWAYQTKQKILFLWFQYLEGVALPRSLVYGRDLSVAQSVARAIRNTKNSGAVPIDLQGQTKDAISVDTLDLHGEGAQQFQTAINWLDQCATNSVLAGFLDLTGAAANGLRGGGGGSYALSKDASDFFLQSLEAECREIEHSVREQLFQPLVRWNFGPSAKVPTYRFEPLNSEDKSAGIALLQAMLATPGTPPPADFVAALGEMVSDYFGMDGKALKQSFVDAAHAAEAKAAQQAAQQAGSGLGSTPVGQKLAGMNGALDKAVATVKAARTAKA